MNTKKWQPIIKNSLVSSKLGEISEILIRKKIDNPFSLMSGDSGIALFLYYYWLFNNEDKYLEKANSIINFNIDLLQSNTNHQFSFCNGLAGFLWTVNHCVENNFILGDCNSLFDQIDSVLFQVMDKDIKEGNYDYLHHALGIGKYFLHRNYEKSINYLESFINELANISIKDRNKIKWKSVVDVKENGSEEIYNISLSHGISSIISFLCYTVKNNILKDKSEFLLKGAIRYLLSCKSVNQNSRSVFPSYIFVEDVRHETTYDSRLAWCYGDLGIGITLWNASKILYDKDLENFALKVLLTTTTRTDPKKEFVVDAGICHGSTGIAHIYNRMYQNTGIPIFKDISTYWIMNSLDKAIYTDGLAGYKTYHPKSLGGMQNQHGLLNGIAGIGLVMLSISSKIEPKWDESLLLS